MDLCRYKDILGKPSQGIHRFRFGGVALVDLLLTVVLSYATTLLTGAPFTITLTAWLLVGLVLHILFCVQTSVVTYIGIKL